MERIRMSHKNTLKYVATIPKRAVARPTPSAINRTGENIITGLALVPRTMHRTKHAPPIPKILPAKMDLQIHSLRGVQGLGAMTIYRTTITVKATIPKLVNAVLISMLLIQISL
jgi:hypothetical protein